VTFEHAYAEAGEEFAQFHGSPREWADWEIEYFPAFMAAKVAGLLGGDVTDPESLAELRERVYATAYAQAKAGSAVAR
jgi:hypothetical protein